MLGSRITQIGALGFSSTDLRKIALPFMLDLNGVYNEGISLYVVQDDQRMRGARPEYAAFAQGHQRGRPLPSDARGLRARLWPIFRRENGPNF